MSAVIVFSAFTFLPETKKPGSFMVTEQKFGRILTAPKVPEVKPKEIKPAKIIPLSIQKFLNKIIIVNNKDSVDILNDLKDLAIGSKTNILIKNTGDQLVVAPSIGISGVSETVKPAEPAVDITKPMESPEVMPEYPGGMEALRKFLMKNLSNPRDLEEGELISVKIKFVVGYDGKLKGFKLIQDGGSEFNNEVIRVLKKMPAWIPGKSKGRNVSVYYTIPVRFIAEG